MLTFEVICEDLEPELLCGVLGEEILQHKTKSLGSGDVRIGIRGFGLPYVFSRVDGSWLDGGWVSRLSRSTWGAYSLAL